MIPKTALSLTLDIAHLSLDDLELFEPGGFSVKLFRLFMKNHSNWTAEEVGRLEVSELEDVFNQIADKIKGAAVPKANATASSNGQRASKSRSRLGPRGSPTPSVLG